MCRTPSDDHVVASTPSGGVLPFHASSGISHYDGIGAYLRSPVELRQANVQFASECLGFANVLEPDMVNAIMAGAVPVTHHPRWKQRIPRDTGASYDFENVRDHYLQHLFGIAAVPLRTTDMRRYWQLSRVALRGDDDPGVLRMAQRSQPQSGSTGLVFQRPVDSGRMGHRR